MKNRILKKAVELASDLEPQKYRLCAIITDKKERILSIGFNSFEKSHPHQAHYAKKVGKKQAIYLHAEISALISLPYDSRPYKMFVARVSKENSPLLAKPCSICTKAIKDSDVKEVYHT